MINIRLKIRDKGYRISSDKYQYILHEVKVQKEDTKKFNKGDEIFKEMGYHPKLEGLISSLCKLDLIEKDITTLKELKDELITTRIHFTRLLTGEGL